METNKAIINREDNKSSLVLQINGQELTLILTEDNPNNIKETFNKLIKELKKGVFCFELHDETLDLYHHICEEYVKQLNTEIKTVYKELEVYELIEKKTS
jgi:cell division protein ZapA (FtsZ GTPase activity inhibitor)